jgi:hypothetical protein
MPGAAISTRDLSGLPDIPGFRKLTKALATLDAILSPEWQYRYYSFNSRWYHGEMMASMRDGSGDLWFALLSDAGVALHGLAHEALNFRPGEPWPGIFDRLPQEFHDNFLREPAFDTANSTFCIWRCHGDERWSCGPLQLPPGSDPDGSAELLGILENNVERYVAFARDYYEIKVAPEDVASVYRHEPLTDALVRRLNPGIALESLKADLAEIGYPESE